MRRRGKNIKYVGMVLEDPFRFQLRQIIARTHWKYEAEEREKRKAKQG